MSVMINGVSVTEMTLHQLIETIQENNRLTEEQNRQMVRYTKGLFWLTVAIGILTAVQIILNLSNIFC